MAVIDRSKPGSAGLNEDQLSLLAQTARGEAARLLAGKGYTILSEENTISILRDMGVELATCEGECEVEIARKLQADWLLSTKVVQFGSGWNLQVNLFQASSGSLMGSERGRAEQPEELVEYAAWAASRLSQGLLNPSVTESRPAPGNRADGSPPSQTAGSSTSESAAEPDAAGLSRTAGPVAGMEFVGLPGGTFAMGSPESEEGRKSDEVLRSVTLSPFSIMTTEVTWAQWNHVMGDPIPRKSLPAHPVTYMDWSSIMRFAERLNELDPSHHYRLPT